MFSKPKHIVITPAEQIDRPEVPSYPYDERMDELHRINHMADPLKRKEALHGFMTDEWNLLKKLGEPSSQAMTSARISSRRE
jgi:hypothetical protein